MSFKSSVKFLSVLTAISAIPGFGQCVDTYTESVNAVLYNADYPYDESRGEVWFNGSKIVTTDGLPALEDIGIYTYSSANYLTKVVELAEESISKGHTSDAVLLYHKFRYSGDHAATALHEDSDMSKDIAKWIKQGTETDGLKKRAEDVASILADTASTADVSSYFANLVSLVNTTTQTQTLQERSNIVCHPAHQAPKQACRQLLQAIANDHTIKDMRHQAVGYNGCYVSYSPAAPVFLDQLHDPAQQCIDTCSGDYVSCRNIGLTMVRDWTITECLSNRPDGCR